MIGRSFSAPGGYFQRLSLRACLALGAAAAALPLGTARADVLAVGDITPFKTVQVGDPPVNVDVPDLPQFGGAVSGGDLVVGGTGFHVEDTEIGQLTIDIPTDTAPLVANTVVVGDESDGSGSITVVTLGSQLRVGQSIIVGNFGQGFLDLVAGGQLSDDPPDVQGTDLTVVLGSQTGSQGYATVRGSGSLLRSNTLTVGEGGFGQLGVTTSARVESLTDVIIGNRGQGNVIGIGNVNVDGQLTRWTIGRNTTGGAGGGAPGSLGNLIVGGQGGRGALNITNQGEVRITNPNNTGGNVTIGDGANSYGEITVDGQLSQLWAFGSLKVSDANNGRGVLYVQNKGLVRANGGVSIGNNGLVQIAGGTLLTPTITNDGVIQTAVGAVGQVDSVVVNNATGEIRAAGTVDRVRDKLLFTKDVTNAGVVTSIGGEIEFTNTVANSAGGLIAGRDAIYRFRTPFANDGSFDFSVGTSDVYGSITNNSSGKIGVAHDTDVTFYNSVINNGNLTVMPGGAAIFLNGLTLAASSALSLQLNEVASVEQIGQLQVVGTAALGGSLNLLAYGGLTPQPGDSFTLISGTTISGTFSSVLFPPAPGNNWTLDYTPTSVVLNFISAPTFNADWDGDGTVTGADLALWTANFGMMVPPGTNGDANYDGVVNGSDFSIWQLQLGTMPIVAAGGSASGAVPEPTTAALLLAALAVAARRRPA
jgi:fibronectin-binding autotransporter adhesin